MTSLVYLLHAGATLALVGLIWTVQLVQYPLFASVGEAAFVDYHAGHARRITWVVGPLMLLEAATTAWLLLRPPTDWPRWIPIAGAALLVAIWLSTAALQVPLHVRLGNGFDPVVHRALVLGNWLRTIAWTARGALVLLGLRLLIEHRAA